MIREKKLHDSFDSSIVNISTLKSLIINLISLKSNVAIQKIKITL